MLCATHACSDSPTSQRRSRCITVHARVRSAAQLNFLHVRAMPQELPPTSDPRKPEISSPKLLVRTSRRISYARTICTHISALAHGMHDSRACNPPLASAKCMNRTSPADNSVQRLVLLFRGAVQNARLLVTHPCLLVDQATGKPTTCRQVRSKCGFLRADGAIFMALSHVASH